MSRRAPHYVSDELIRESGLSPEVFDFISQLSELYDVSRVVVFGSRARGDFRPKSDIDLAVTGGSVGLFA